MDELTYLSSIEELFIEKRGCGLILSPKDWHMARRWEKEGIPLPVVLRGITRVFEQIDSQKQVRSLAYCEGEIKKLWKESQKQLAGAPLPQEEDDTPAEPASRTLSQELGACLQTALLNCREEQLRTKLQSCYASLQDLQESTWRIQVKQLSNNLLVFLKDYEGKDKLQALRDSVHGQLRDYETQMSEAAYQRTCETLLKEQLLDEYGLGPLAAFAD